MTLSGDEPLRDQDRTGFSCGVEALDRYLLEQAGQDKRRNVAATYVVLHEGSSRVAGYYTLSAFAISPASLGPHATRRLPRYEAFPALLIGRLAVDRRFHGRGLGRRLLAMALRRCLSLSEQLGAIAVVVDAKNDDAHAFYEREGFLRFEDHPYLYVPMRSIAQAYASE